MSKILEAKDLNLFKTIVELFSKFIDSQPGTGMNKVYRKIMDAGLKSVPKDKKAQEIIEAMISDNVPKSVQDLLNTSFVELPIVLRPLYKAGNSKTVAFWKKGDKIYTKVFDLLNLDGEGAGMWTDEKGEKVDLIDLSKEE